MQMSNVRKQSVNLTQESRQSSPNSDRSGKLSFRIRKIVSFYRNRSSRIHLVCKGRKVSASLELVYCGLQENSKLTLVGENLLQMSYLNLLLKFSHFHLTVCSSLSKFDSLSLKNFMIIILELSLF